MEKELVIKNRAKRETGLLTPILFNPIGMPKESRKI